jgi:exosortase/archaeosortase family protein
MSETSASRPLRSLDFSLPPVDAATRRHRSRPGTAAGLAMYGVALWMALDNHTFRRLEVEMITPLTGFVTGRHEAVASDTLVWFARGTPRVFGLNLTTECTSALLLIPLLVMVGSFAIFTRLSLIRQLGALLGGAALILAVNAMRVAGIAWATWKWGRGVGYGYSHVFVGSAFSLVGFVAAMLVALWILARGERPARAWHRGSSRRRHEIRDRPNGAAHRRNR